MTRMIKLTARAFVIVTLIRVIHIYVEFVNKEGKKERNV